MQQITRLPIFALLTAVLVSIAVADVPGAQGDANGQLAQLQLAYEGSFRVPAGSTDAASFDFGGSAPAFDPVRRSIWMVGHDHHQQVAEISIPAIRRSQSVAGLDTARILTPFRDVLQGRLPQVGSPGSKIGGLLPVGGDLIVSVYVYYDAPQDQTLSHFRVAANGTVTGPVQIGTESRQAGFVAGYMTFVPPEWRNDIGGPALTGQCCLSIISRTSLGPSLTAFDPAEVAVRSPVSATRLLAYPIDHPTLGTWEKGTRYNGAASVGGVVFPPGTDSILFFGRTGLGEICYGVGTDQPALHGRPIPESGGEVVYCYDPASGEYGGHGYPYVPYVWAYDVRELIAVRRGQKAPWEVEPYAAGPIDLPFSGGISVVSGATYDPATQRIFLSVLYQDEYRPLIHVLRFGSDGPPPVVEEPDAAGNDPTPPSSDRRRPWTNPPTGRAVPR